MTSRSAGPSRPLSARSGLSSMRPRAARSSWAISSRGGSMIMRAVGMALMGRPSSSKPPSSTVAVARRWRRRTWLPACGITTLAWLPPGRIATGQDSPSSVASISLEKETGTTHEKGPRPWVTSSIWLSTMMSAALTLAMRWTADTAVTVGGGVGSGPAQRDRRSKSSRRRMTRSTGRLGSNTPS